MELMYGTILWGLCKAGADPTHDKVTNLSKMYFLKFSSI